MRATVVGGSSFIGSHLVDRLADLSHEVTVLDHHDRAWDAPPPQVRDIRGALETPDALAAAVGGADVVFHLAWATIHEVSNVDPAADVRANLLPSLALLQACLRHRVRRIVFVSSGGTIYGRANRFPIPEDHPLEPLNAYGIHKMAVEKHLQLAQFLHGLEVVVLRPSVAYGPRQSPFARQGAPAVFLQAVASGQPLTVWGDGGISRDYAYVSDLVEALVRSALVADAAPGVYNIGGPEEISLLALIAAVERTVGRAAVVRYEPARPFDAPRIVLDTRRARDVLGWQPFVRLDDGLARTWDWMRRAVP
jgi:UDP-glucose 4-epimerase